MNVEKTINHITHWIKKYILDSNMDGYTIGISGGVDSAVTSTLAAMTGMPLLCVEMPICQNKEQVNRGKKHIEWLKKSFDNIEVNEINLTPVFNTFKDGIPQDRMSNLGLANTRARLRMTTLYYLAQKNNYLVLGTGNKVEDFGVGFFTKYGDGGVDISPIADLLKTEVYMIAKYLNIINEILIAPPTDGLWENNKTDEEQIGATYQELEQAMHHDKNKQTSKREKEVLEIYRRLHQKNLHKIHPIPVCKIPEELK